MHEPPLWKRESNRRLGRAIGVLAKCILRAHHKPEWSTCKMYFKEGAEKPRDLVAWTSRGWIENDDVLEEVSHGEITADSFCGEMTD